MIKKNQEISGSIGQRVDYLRKEEGLSYAGFAEKIGVITGDAIRKAIVRDAIKPIYVRKISEVFSVSREWLETGIGEMQASRQNIPMAIESTPAIEIMKQAKNTGYISEVHAEIVLKQLESAILLDKSYLKLRKELDSYIIRTQETK